MLIRQGKERLEQGAAESPGLAAEFLMAHTLGCEPQALRRVVLLKPAESVPANMQRKFFSFIERHAKGEPVAYIIGEWEFYGIKFFLSPATLIPRPESELLVQSALAVISEMERPVRFADLGTGSGCLAVAAMKNLTGKAFALCVDISPEALKVAQRNILRHGLQDCMCALEADYTKPFAGKGGLDLILANPPYVSAEEYRGLAEAVRVFEPPTALVPDSGRGANGQTGLEHIRILAEQCADMLRPGGRLLMEIGGTQGPGAIRFFQENGGWTKILVQPDLAGRDRLLTASVKY